MPVEVSIDVERNLVRRRISGEVSLPEMVSSFEDTLRHPDYRPGMSDITDLRDHVHEATGDEIRKVAETVKGHIHMTGNVRLALVVSRTVSYGLTRMFQMLLDDTPWEIAIFESPDEAEHWLGVA